MQMVQGRLMQNFCVAKCLSQCPLAELLNEQKQRPQGEDAAPNTRHSPEIVRKILVNKVSSSFNNGTQNSQIKLKHYNSCYTIYAICTSDLGFVCTYVCEQYDSLFHSVSAFLFQCLLADHYREAQCWNAGHSCTIRWLNSVNDKIKPVPNAALAAALATRGSTTDARKATVDMIGLPCCENGTG